MWDRVHLAEFLKKPGDRVSRDCLDENSIISRQRTIDMTQSVYVAKMAYLPTYIP